MKLKEAIPKSFRQGSNTRKIDTKKRNIDTDLDTDDTHIDWLKSSPPRKIPLPPREPVRREDLEIVVDRMKDGFYRAMIKTVKGKAYGSSLSHPEEFMASGRSPEAAKEELFKKLKI